MKKRFVIVFLLSLFLLIPSGVNAREYTFNICEDCDWNFDNLNELENHIYNIYNRDYEDNKLENKYIINMPDGNYNFDYSFPMFETNNTEIHFGEGTYHFESLSLEGFRYVLKGKGVGKTIVNTTYLGSESNDIIGIFDMTLNISDRFNLDSKGENFNDNYYGYEYRVDEDKSGFRMENVEFNYTGDSYSSYIMINCYQYMPSLIINNVKYTSRNPLRFEFENDGDWSYDIPGQIVDNLSISNSDFSGGDIYFGVDGRVNYISINNTKLRKVYAGYGITLRIDCDSTFEGGMKKQFGTLEYDSFFEQNQYNLYGYYYDEYPEDDHNAKIITESCKKKDIKITKALSLKQIEDEFGFKLDETWIFNPKGIAEIKDDKIVPLKVGVAKVSKEIDGEIQTLIIEVLPDQIINPKTATPYIIIGIVLGIVALSIKIIRKKKTINI